MNRREKSTDGWEVKAELLYPTHGRSAVAGRQIV
jgi:hypothetical protein